MFHGINLARWRINPLPLTSPCAKQGVHPEQRTQMNSTGKIRLCEIPCSLDLLHVPVFYLYTLGLPGMAQVVLGPPSQSWGLSHGISIGHWSWLPPPQMERFEGIPSSIPAVGSVIPTPCCS